MIEGHYYLSMIIPSAEKIPFAVAGMVLAFAIGYCLIEGIKYYGKWRHDL